MFGGRVKEKRVSVSETLNRRSKQRERPKLFVDRAAFWRGFASAFNVWGNFYPIYYGRDPQRADYEALLSDWSMIGRDMERSIRRFEKAHAKELAEARQERLFDPDEETG